MYSGRGNAALPALGFPIREPAGQRMFSSSPRLIAAVHALHRLLVPRHPPCALTILTVIEPDAEKPPGSGDTRLKIGQHLRFSRSGEERRAGDSGGPVSQNSTACGTPSREEQAERVPEGTRTASPPREVRARATRLGRHARRPAGILARRPAP